MDVDGAMVMHPAYGMRGRLRKGRVSQRGTPSQRGTAQPRERSPQPSPAIGEGAGPLPTPAVPSPSPSPLVGRGDHAGHAPRDASTPLRSAQHDNRSPCPTAPIHPHASPLPSGEGSKRARPRDASAPLSMTVTPCTATRLRGSCLRRNDGDQRACGTIPRSSTTPAHRRRNDAHAAGERNGSRRSAPARRWAS